MTDANPVRAAKQTFRRAFSFSNAFTLGRTGRMLYAAPVCGIFCCAEGASDKAPFCPSRGDCRIAFPHPLR